jgi:hypothetical protein
MLALAWLNVTRASLADDSDTLVTSANEIRRMLTALCSPPRDERHARNWSRWRHRSQERARHCHYQRQQPRRSLSAVGVLGPMWPYLGLTMTLNAAVHCAPLTSISPGQTEISKQWVRL